MPIGFLMGAPGDEYYKAVAQVQDNIYKETTGGEYQKFGTGVYKYVLKRADYEYFNIDKHEVYQTHWSRALDIFIGKFDVTRGIGLHWYGGSDAAREFEPKINDKNWDKFPIGKAMRFSLR